MATVDLQIFTGPYDSITTPIQINVYAESDPLAIVASVIHDQPHTDQETWDFPGLDRVNYLFRIFQMADMSSGTIIQQLGKDMYVVPGSYSNMAVKNTEQITADVTTGFSSGVNIVVFDGTSGKEDWRGWDIGTLTRMGGEGVMKKGIEYSWNINTGQLQLLKIGDLYDPAEWFNVEFEDQVTQVTSSPPSSLPLFSSPKVITANYTVNAGSDFGSGLIIRPAGLYLEITLPDIATVVAGKMLTVEFGTSATQKCAKLICQAGQTIDWLRGNRSNLYFVNEESFWIYKYVDTSNGTTANQWRIVMPYGNWHKVGEQMADDTSAANVYNKIMLNGPQLDSQQYARLYNDYVANLPASQRCNYDDWTTGNNKYLWSLANSANPANAGKFMAPNRQNMFERISDGTRTPGSFQIAALLSHSHYNGVADDKPAGDADSVFVYGTTTAGMPGSARGQISNGSGGTTYQGSTSTAGSADHCPSNIAVYKYAYV